MDLPLPMSNRRPETQLEAQADGQQHSDGDPLAPRMDFHTLPPMDFHTPPPWWVAEVESLQPRDGYPVALQIHPHSLSAPLHYRPPTPPRGSTNAFPDWRAAPMHFPMLPHTLSLPMSPSSSLGTDSSLLPGAERLGIACDRTGRTLTANIEISGEGGEGCGLRVICTRLSGEAVLEMVFGMDADISYAKAVFVGKLRWRPIVFFSDDGKQVWSHDHLRNHSRLTLMELKADSSCNKCKEYIRGAIILQGDMFWHFGCRDASMPWEDITGPDGSSGLA